MSKDALEKAIEILKIDFKDLKDKHQLHHRDSNLLKSIQLGIEALERLKDMRNSNRHDLGYIVARKPLPSEEELITIGKSKYTKEELADLRHNACDDTIG